MRSTKLVAPVDWSWLEAASREIAASEDLDTITEIRDEAEAVRRVLDAANAGVELQNRVAEIRLRAERRAGELLRRLRLRGGDRRSKSHRESLTLKQLGIDRNRSSRWQREASVPEACFQEFLTHAKQNSREISSAALLRFAKRWRDSDCEAATTETPARWDSLGGRPRPSCEGTDRAPAEVLDELQNQLMTLQSILLMLQSQPPCMWSPAQLRTCQLYVSQSIDAAKRVRQAMLDSP